MSNLLLPNQSNIDQNGTAPTKILSGAQWVPRFLRAGHGDASEPSVPPICKDISSLHSTTLTPFLPYMGNNSNTVLCYAVQSIESEIQLTQYHCG